VTKTDLELITKEMTALAPTTIFADGFSRNASDEQVSRSLSSILAWNAASSLVSITGQEPVSSFPVAIAHRGRSLCVYADFPSSWDAPALPLWEADR
jgi:hypothetical protein